MWCEVNQGRVGVWINFFLDGAPVAREGLRFQQEVTQERRSVSLRISRSRTPRGRGTVRDPPIVLAQYVSGFHKLGRTRSRACRRHRRLGCHRASLKAGKFVLQIADAFFQHGLSAAKSCAS